MDPVLYFYESYAHTIINLRWINQTEVNNLLGGKLNGAN